MNEKYISDLITKDFRIDGRKLEDYRKPIKIEYDVSNNAEGSAKVTIGETEVVVGIKLGVGEPYPESPDEGSIVVTAELLPMSNPKFESGPPGKESNELARIVDRGIRESKCVDFKELGIKEGEACWMVFIDIYPLNDAGNLIDASALAALAALKKCKIPKLDKDNKVVVGEYTKDKLNLKKEPITVTVWNIKDKIFVDALSEEEEAGEARLTVAISEDGNINAMQKGGRKSLSIDEIEKMVKLAEAKSKELRKVLK